jgi:hypothetical protein
MPHRIMQKRLSTGLENALDNGGKLRPAAFNGRPQQPDSLADFG